MGKKEKIAQMKSLVTAWYLFSQCEKEKSSGLLKDFLAVNCKLKVVSDPLTTRVNSTVWSHMECVVSSSNSL